MKRINHSELKLSLFERSWHAFTLMCLGLSLINVGASLNGSQEINTDICVYGGTSGGVIAAVQAARMGKTVALVVVDNHLGGMTSGGLGATDVGNWGNSHPDNYIQGVAREFYTRVGQKYGSNNAAFAFEPHVAETVFTEMAAQAGVLSHTNQQLASILMQGQQILSLTMTNGNIFHAREFIDASYEGDVMAKAGVSYTIGREATSQYGENYNGTQIPNTGGHQFGAYKVNPYLVTNNPASGLIPCIQTNSFATPGSADNQVQAYSFRMCLTQNATNQLPITAPANYDASQYELLIRYIQALIAEGTSPSLWSLMTISVMPNGKTDINNSGPVSTDLLGQNYNYAESDPTTRAQIWQAHKNYVQGFFYFLASDTRVPSNIRSQAGAYSLCKDEFVDSNGWPYQLYIRETRRMISDYIITQSNCLGQVVVPDSIGLAAYMMDSHNCRRAVVNGYVQNEGDVEAGVSEPYPIPYRSIVPKIEQCTNLLVPWCLSATHIAFGSIRMEPVFMILSQSASTAACLAIDDAVAVQNVSIVKLQAQLSADKQLLSLKDGSLNAIVVDNADATGIKITGPWSSGAAISGYYGSDYLNDGNTNKGSSSVTFVPNLPQSGLYNVYARWTAYSNRAHNVPIDIISPTGTNTVIVDQTQNNGLWVFLLTTNFNNGTNGMVQIRNTGTDGYVVADAVQFVSPTNLPVINLWATDAKASVWSQHSGSFTMSRMFNTNTALTLYLNISGTAVSDVDYDSIPNSITLPAGVISTNMLIVPHIRAVSGGDKTIMVSLLTNPLYDTGSLTSATVTIKNRPFDDWLQQYFGTNATNPAIAGDSACPAGDGVSNLMKYALGLNPTNAVEKSLITMVYSTNGAFGLSCTRPDPPPADVSYRLAVSDDLLNWATESSAFTSLIVLNNNNTATVSFVLTVPMSATSKKFMRLQIMRQHSSKTIQGATVVAFGDSITYGYGVPSDQTWTSQVQTRFNLNMINAGVSGNTSSQGLARMDHDVAANKPDFVIINFGMNDHVMTAANSPAVSPATFTNNLIAMINNMRTIGAIPILVTPNYIIEGDATQYYYNRHPASYYSNVGGAQVWLDSYVQQVRNVAAFKGVELVDLRKACDNYDRYSFLRSLANGANTDDGVHPYLVGSSVYAQMIGDYLAAHY